MLLRRLDCHQLHFHQLQLSVKVVVVQVLDSNKYIWYSRCVFLVVFQALQSTNVRFLKSTPLQYNCHLYFLQEYAIGAKRSTDNNGRYLTNGMIP